MSCEIFVCYHKPSFVPENKIIVPMHAGKALSNLDLGFAGDNTKDNISEKNPYFCELTITYWIWKNVKADIVGLMHYRRFFNFKNDETKFHKFSPDFLQKYGISEQNIKQILKDYDIILPKRTPGTKNSVYEHYKKEHVISDLDKALDIIKSKYPKMYKSAEDILKNNSHSYPTNMLICKKALFDKYAEWLFSILFELEKKIQTDVDKRDSYQKRSYGFLAERLTTVFVAAHPDLKIKELPIAYYEDNLKMYIKYRIKMLKRRFLTLLGINKAKWKM